MKYFIDTIDNEEINLWERRLGQSFAGVTTNSSMLKTVDDLRNFYETLEYPLLDHNHNPVVMFQISEEGEMLKFLKHYLADMVIAKVSIIEENFSLINQLKVQHNLRTAGTTCYDLIQINQAIEMKMDYTMVYYAKNDYKGLLEDAVKLKKDSGSNIKLVAASIHTVEEVTHAIKSGIEYCTCRPDVLALLFNNADARREIDAF